MSNELMIPEAGQVPAYIRNPELARKANEEAAAGISTGFPPRVKLAGKQFSLVDGNGDEKPFPPAKLVAGPDGNVYMPAIVLRAKRELVKTWYAKAYNPNAEAQAPDCFSNDSERPDPSVQVPQCDVCANCPMNAFGSGKDQNGNPTAGKACTDTKILAVLIPGFGVHAVRIPPASLKNFGLYVKQLSSNGIPLGNVKTFIGFDMAATFPVMVFKFGGFLEEKLLPKLAELATSPEAEEIVNTKVIVTTTAPAPTPAETAPTTAEDLGLGEDDTKKAEEEAKAQAKKDAAAKKKAEAEAKKKAEEAAKAEEETQSAGPTDDEIAAELGL